MGDRSSPSRCADRDPLGAPDSVLSALDNSGFDEMWLFAVDVGDGLTPEDCEAITRFRRNGGGLLVTRDHMDLGSSICTLGGVGKAHHFHSRIWILTWPTTRSTILFDEYLLAELPFGGQRGLSGGRSRGTNSSCNGRSGIADPHHPLSAQPSARGARQRSRKRTGPRDRNRCKQGDRTANSTSR